MPDGIRHILSGLNSSCACRAEVEAGRSRIQIRLLCLLCLESISSIALFMHHRLVESGSQSSRTESRSRSRTGSIEGGLSSSKKFKLIGHFSSGGPAFSLFLEGFAVLCIFSTYRISQRFCPFPHLSSFFLPMFLFCFYKFLSLFTFFCSLFWF